MSATDPPMAAGAVPDSDTLRRRALQASWQRDRRIAQRRLRWRWTLWLLARAVPVLALAAALGAAWWTWWQPAGAAGPAAAQPTTPLSGGKTR